MIADGQHKEEFKLQEKESLCKERKLNENPKYESKVKLNKDFKPCIKAKLDVDTLDSEISEPEEVFVEKQDSMTAEKIYEKNFNIDLKSIKDKPSTVDKRHQSNQKSDRESVNNRLASDKNHVLFKERLQMSCVVKTFLERVSLSNESIIKITTILFYDNVDNNANNDCESSAYIFSDYSSQSTSAVIQTNMIQELSDEVEEKTAESSKKKCFRKKRRRRRHKFKNHHRNSRRNYDILKSKRFLSQAAINHLKVRKNGNILIVEVVSQQNANTALKE